MGEELKCQFCSLGFTSVYKIIPHIYFGHRKKVTKYVREHGEVVLRCPAKCDFNASRPVDKGSGPDLVFPALSQVLAEQETHMVEMHTEELKLTVCPYCNIDLEQLVYWEHLEEHMGAAPNTKTPPKPEQPTAPKHEQSRPDESETGNQLEQTGVGQVLSQEEGCESSHGEPSTSVVRAPSLVEENKSPCSEAIQPTVNEAKLGSNDDTRERKEFISSGNAASNEEEEEALQKKQEAAEEARKQALEEEERKRALEEEERRQALEEEMKKQALEEEMKKQALEEEMKKQVQQEEMRRQAIEEEIKKQAKQEEIRNKLKEIERKIAEKKREDKKKAEDEAAAAAAAAHLKAEEECAEADRLIREGEAAEAERKAKEEKALKATNRQSKEEKPIDIAQGANEGANEQPEVNEEQILSAAVEASMKEEEGKKTLPGVTPEKPGAVKRKSGSENSSSSSRTSPIVGASPREEKKSPGDPVGRSRRSDDGLKTEEKTRKLSGKPEQERKVGEQEKVRRESGKKTSGGAWDVVEKVAVEKPKPVLTEEMEREIIFGSFKKEKKVEKKEMKEEVMPPTKKIDKKESREEKLQSVRKEIESRFREEEDRRKKEKQEREERMKKEREKQRKHEEKLQKEREKLLKEKREERKRQKVDKELLVKEAAADVEQEYEAMDTTEIEAEVEAEEEPRSPEFTNPYERIKEEILKMEKEKAEMDKKRQMEKEAEEREEAEEEEEEESRSPSRSRGQSIPSSFTPVEETRTVRMVTPPRTVKMISTPPRAGDGDDDDLDDLEMLMRDFKEAESKEKVLTPARPPPAAKVDSLALLRDSYGAKKARSPSPTETKSATIPSGFDADGHPLPGAGSPLLARATTSAALAIMGPAKKDKSNTSSTQLECSVCKEEASATSHAYISAYQLLSHVFLAHRKKIVSRSRKARGMTLACPEGCGFVTRQSAQVYVLFSTLVL